MAVTARFTPSVLDGDLLEDLFVAREHLVADAVGRIERAARGEERSARLFVGPRGAGKTHLLSLVAHRARSLPGFGSSFQLAWLSEDMWTIDGYDDLIDEIVGAIEPAVEEASGPSSDRLRAAVAERGPVVVLVENLDRVFGDIGADGQRRLRALIENDRSLLLIATTTRLDDEMRGTGFPLPDDDERPAYFRETDWPFYGFFDTFELPPFTLDQAAEMLAKIATASGDERLAAELEGPTIRRRLAAIDRLAGGQPRMWALLAAGLSIEGLDELVEALMTRFDDLTPYFQSQMQTLSPQERKVVRALADAPGSLNVGQIAERSGIGDKAAARTIAGLRKKGWLRLRTGPIVAKADGRLSYYDLAEPLARLAFQLKESRGEPVRTVVEFLKHWFAADDLAPLGTDPTIDAYLTLAARERRLDPAHAVADTLGVDPLGYLTIHETDPPFDPAEASFLATLKEVDDDLAALEGGDPRPLLGRPSTISGVVEMALEAGVAVPQLRLRLARKAFDADPPLWQPTIEAIITSGRPEVRPLALAMLAAIHGRRGHVDVARAVFEEIDHDDLDVWLETAFLLRSAGALELALAAAERAHDLEEDHGDIVLVATVRAAVLQDLGRSDEEVEMWQAAIAAAESIDPTDEDTFSMQSDLAEARHRAGDVEGAATGLADALSEARSVLGAPHDTCMWLGESLVVMHLHRQDLKAGLHLALELRADASETRDPLDARMLHLSGTVGVLYALNHHWDEAKRTLTAALRTAHLADADAATFRFLRGALADLPRMEAEVSGGLEGSFGDDALGAEEGAQLADE